MIAHWPNGITLQDRWVRDPVHVMDLMPTLCDVAGARYPKTREGVAVQPTTGTSLVPTFGGESLPERFVAYAWGTALNPRGDLVALPTDIGPGTMLVRTDLPGRRLWSGCRAGANGKASR